MSKKKFYPNVYTNEEKEAIKDYLENPQRMIPAEYTVGPIAEWELLLYAHSWDKWNPLYNNKQYALNAGYCDIPAIPGFIDPEVRTMLPKELGHPISPTYAYIGDGYDHEVEYLLPIYAGDTLKVIATDCKIIDITPESGSEIRGFIIEDSAEMYNQHGNLVEKATMRWPEFRTKYTDTDELPDPEKMRPNMIERYEHEIHNYTEEDWNYFIEIWRNESITGKHVRFWDDVNIGDEPQPCTEGPINQIEMIRSHGHEIICGSTVREFLMDGKSFFIKNENGMYYPHNFSHFVTHFGARPQFFNVTGRNHILRMISNWCGDAGRISKVNWRIVNNLAPEKQQNRFPHSYRRPSFLLKVPHMKGRYLNSHGIVPDSSSSRGYVTDKFKLGNEHFIEIVCWSEDILGNIFTECLVTVKLPKK